MSRQHQDKQRGVLHWLGGFVSVVGIVLAVWPVAGQGVSAVTTRPLAELLISQELRAPARVVSKNQSVLSSQVSAPIMSLHADVGQAVKAGEVLLQLDPQDYQLAADLAAANLNASNARIRQAELRLVRAQELSKQQYVSADDLLARETDLAVLRAEHTALQVQSRIARRNLEKCTVSAPFDGVVTKRFANLGALASPGTVLLTLIETEAMEVEAEVPSQHIASLTDGQNVRFAGGQQMVPVSVARITAAIEENNRNQLVRLKVDSDQLVPGASGELVWLAARGLLPANLVVNRDGKLGVFVVEDESARFIVLQDAQEGRPAAVELPPDSRIIVRGRDRVSDGDPVTVSPP